MIPHNRPTLGVDEQAAAARVIEAGWVAQGPEVNAFENELCRFFNLPDGHAVAVSSGSAALFLALWALNGKDKRIGLPVYSCSALRNAVGMIGGQSIYLDCEANSPNLDFSAVERAGLDILIAPSMFGLPVKLPSHRNYKLIEDLAQSIGACVGNEKIGLRGELGICSFYATKLMTTGGQGGAVMSRDKDLIDLIRDYREFDCRYDRQIRFNFQMTDLQAAVGRVQLARLPYFMATREKWYSMYKLAGLSMLSDKNAGVIPVRYRIVMLTRQPSRVIAALNSAGIRAIVPIEEYELLDGGMHYPVAVALANSSVSLPAWPGLKEEDVLKIARIAGEFA